ncbi:MAG TPA: hypothetical protein VL175_19645 [Pirellulales bacterium]|jgi:hypothetical protein|nr:hypothetical protein [Pirellulales bacterium]
MKDKEGQPDAGVKRFIVRYRGAGAKPDDVVRRIMDLPDTAIIDSSNKMLLVEGSEDAIQRALGPNHNWLVAPQQHYELLD